MAAKIIDLADSIADYLGTLSFPTTVTVERQNMPDIRAERVRQPRVYVHPISIAQAVATRGHWDGLFEIGITFAQLLNTNQLSEQDTLIGMAEELPLKLIDFSFGGAVLETIEEESSRVVFDVQQMETGTVFMAVITLVFRNEVN